MAKEKPEEEPEAEPKAKPKKKKKKKKKKKAAAKSIKLVIVESPAKCKTIKKCLGRGYDVVATMGHIRDLPAGKLGIDVENNFEPTYRTIRGRAKTVKDLKKHAKNASEVYLACDLDREGEAIAWHVAELLSIPDDKVFRIKFNEITKEAITSAFNNPLKLDMDKVNAQQARRLLDRLVGYTLSPLLWQKIAKGLSAGRVQSVVVRLIVEREKEILAFEPKEYWEIDAMLGASKDTDPFLAKLHKIKGEDPEIVDEKTATGIVENLKESPFIVTSVEKKQSKRKAPPPLTTSLLQQRASTKLRFSTKKTMVIAQQLYEGVEIGDEGPVGLITYMRTDSFHLAPVAVEAGRAYIKEAFGDEYLPDKPNVYKSRKRAQEAHEAIRPSYVTKRPEDVKKYLNKDQMALYDLIWSRFVASQMTPAIYDMTNVLVDAGDCTFRAHGTSVAFAGYTAVLGRDDDDEDKSLPPMEEKQALELRELLPKQCFTKPPPRYSEATLVKTLEKEGIGRPSTYSPIISTIRDRGYVDLLNRAFHATELGTLVTDNLVKFFSDILDVQFTSGMEENLDEIEDGKVNYVGVLKKFYTPFEKDVKEATENMETVKVSAETDEKCPQCEQPLLLRWSRTGKFYGCKGFPECRYTRSVDQDDLEDLIKDELPCEKCGKAMVVKSGRRGRFLACSGYPDCKNTRSIPTKYPCPQEDCDGRVVERSSKRGRRFYGCSKYPDCDFTINQIPSEWIAEEEEEKKSSEESKPEAKAEVEA